jgi:hypothetical protein
MSLEVGKILPVMLKDLSPRDRAKMAAQVVEMLQGTGKILQASGASSGVISSFNEDASTANAIARLTVADEGFDPELALQAELLKTSK